MHLCLASSDQREGLYNSSDAVNCGCDTEKLGVIHRYLRERFPDRAVREFHSHSTVVVQGFSPAPYANYHVISLSDDLPYCAVLTRQFLELPIEDLSEHLRRWDLARAMQVDRMVIVDDDGLSQL